MYIQSNQLVTISPIGENQQKVFDAWTKDKNLFLSGSAGTGKTFILLYLALKAVLDKVLLMIRWCWLGLYYHQEI